MVYQVGGQPQLHDANSAAWIQLHPGNSHREAGLAYFDSYRSARVPANLIQAQRDYFGAHTYHKVNSDGDIIVDQVGEPVVFHTEWMLEDRPEIKV